MAQSPEIDPVHGKPMSQNMRRTLWAIFAILSLGGMSLVTWQWRQQRKAMSARAPKIDRSAKSRNTINPASPPKDPTFAKPKAAAAGQGPASRD